MTTVIYVINIAQTLPYSYVRTCVIQWVMFLVQQHPGQAVDTMTGLRPEQ
jgi:hypothetical protein